MREEFVRSAMLLGEENIEKLAAKKVAVFGLGGVGGYVAEALARGGVGALDFIDGDVISLSNINRQILALRSTVGKYKAEIAASRAKDINPQITVNAYNIFYGEDNKDKFDFKNYDYVVDAVDTVTAKLLIIENCKRCATPVISCMGTGNKLDPMAFKVADISNTSVCPLARVMRRELKARGVEKLKVVYSEELPSPRTQEENGKHIPGSVSFVPSAAGLLIASEVIKNLLQD